MNDVVDQEGVNLDTTGADNGAEDAGKKNDETSSNNSDLNVDDIVQSWRATEERNMQLEEENYKLRQQSSTTSADDDDLDEEERIEKRVQARIKEQEDQKELAMKRAEREDTFMTKTSPVYRAHKEDILKIAVSAKVSLPEATKIYQERSKAVTDAQKATQDGKKKNAGTGAGGNSGGTSVGHKGYDPKVDANKSIDDLFRESL